MAIIYDLAFFLKKPILSDEVKIKSLISGLILILKTFLIILLMNLVVSSLVVTPLKLLNLFPANKGLILNTHSILKVIILSPILEELLFRLPIKLSKQNLAISFCVLLFYLASRINPTAGVLLSIIVLIFLMTWIQKQNDFSEKITSFYKQYFHIFFYLQALIFGCLHLSNYNLDHHLFLIFPLFILNYIILGCIFGYIRIRYSFGLYLCMLTHIAINGLYCLIFA